MSSASGIQPIGDYATPVGDKAKVQALIDIIPNPDATPGTGAVAGGGQGVTNTYLDEMSPVAAAVLRAELLALKNAVS